jgi:hypothetical protein
MKGFSKLGDIKQGDIKQGDIKSDRLDPVTLETYVNKIQNIKRTICEEILNGKTE